MTFLISSHLLDELGKIATKYGILKDGVLVEEIEAAELMKSCRSGLTIRVNDPQKAVALLRENGFEDVFADGDTICVNGDVGNLSAVNELLVRGGAGVYELSARNADVEDFFIERMG